MAVDAKSIIDEVLEKMRLNATTPVAVPRTRVLREINNMLKDLTEHSYCFIKKDDDVFTLVDGTRSYELPSDCYELIRVYDSDEKKVYPITIEQLEDMSRDWPDDEGTPEYFILGYEAANYLTFYPKPGSDEADAELGAIYRYYPTDVTDSASSYLTGPIANNKQLAVNWCLGQLSLAKSEVQDQTVAQAYLNAYYFERKRWESRPKAPDRTRIMGIRGEQAPSTLSPNIPDEITEA